MQKVHGKLSELLIHRHINAFYKIIEQTLLENIFGKQLTEQELASYLMYLKVFTDSMKYKLKYGTLSSIPSSVFFKF